MDNFNRFLAQYDLVTPQSWDNTGLLIDSNSNPNTIFLTIDVTPLVIQECINKNHKFILSYHPVIFAKLSRISSNYIALIQNNISVYSIHTALDKKMCLFLCHKLKADPICVEDSFLVCNSKDTIKIILEKCKAMTGKKAIRYVLSDGHSIDHIPSSIIIGVGAAQDSFKAHIKDSLIITGEMRHHDMLFYKSNGCSVVLMEHSNCERIYFEKFKTDLEDYGFKVEVSEFDVDPVEFY